MFVVNHRKIFFAFSAVLVALSLFSVFFYGLNWGIDFTGGSILEIEYLNGRPELSVINEEMASLEMGEFNLKETGETGLILRTKELSEGGRFEVFGALSVNDTYSFQEKRFNSIGPVIGEELKNKAMVAIVVVIIAIVLFIAFAFRKVSEPVSSWKYGLVAIVALLHDIIIPVGIFAFLGQVSSLFQIDALFITALLAILGFSVNDTIVVFDRVRENLKNSMGNTFLETVGISLRQTYVRSINTSLTTLAVLLTLYFLGSESVRGFTLVLSIGVVVGTYSSIFLASPLLVVLGRNR